MILQITSAKRKRRSHKDKPSTGIVRVKQACHAPILPKVMGCHAGSQGKTEILALRSQIQVQDLLATGALIDKLEYRTVQHKYLPTSSFSDRKDLNHAIAVITNWSKLEQSHQRHQLILSE